MRKLKLKETANTQELKERMEASKSVSDYKKWQVLYIISIYEVDAEYLSTITGYSKAMVYNIVQTFNKTKITSLGSKPRGGRRRSYMSLDEEKEFMATLESKALEGHIMTFHDIQKAIANKLGHQVSDDFIWDLFKRNGWTKHSPRPHHPFKNTDQQEDFKKNSRTIWLPLKMILSQP